MVSEALIEQGKTRIKLLSAIAEESPDAAQRARARAKLAAEKAEVRRAESARDGLLDESDFLGLIGVPGKAGPGPPPRRGRR